MINTTYQWRGHPILLNPLPPDDCPDDLHIAIATSKSSTFRQIAREPEHAIASVQLDLLWAEIFESESPGAIVELAPYRLIYGNPPANREALSSKFSEETRDRYLLALFRDGVWDRLGVRSEVIRLTGGLIVAMEKPQDLSQ